MRTERTAAKLLLIAAIALLMLLLCHSLSATGSLSRAGNAEFTATIDESVEVSQSGKYEALVIEVTVDVKTPETYTLYGDLSHSGIEATFYSEELELEAGIHTIEARFLGGDIYASNIDGPYDVYFQLYAPNFVDTLEYTTTQAYKYTQFEPSVTSNKPNLEWVGGAVTFTTDIATFVVNTGHPTIEVRYETDPDGSRSGMRLSFDEIVGFADTDGDKLLSGSDSVVCTADLRNVAWSFDMRLQESYDISFQAVVTLYTPSNDAYGSLKLGIYVESDDLDMTSSDLGFSVELTLLGPLNVDFVALERVITDITDSHDLVDNNLTESLGISDDIWESHCGVRSNKGSEEHGRYYYRLYPDVEFDTGEKESRRVLSGFSEGDDALGQPVMSVTTAYPIDSHTVNIVHTQKIGLNPDNKVDPPSEEPENNPILYITGFVLAGGLVAGTIFFQQWRSKKKKESSLLVEEEEVIEDEPEEETSSGGGIDEDEFYKALQAKMEAKKKEPGGRAKGGKRRKKGGGD